MTTLPHLRPAPLESPEDRNALVDSFRLAGIRCADMASPMPPAEARATTSVRVRKLPAIPPPVCYETVESYLHRLETANQMDRGALANRFQRNSDWLSRLVQLTGRDRDHLAFALPEVTDTQRGPRFGHDAEQLKRPERARPYCQRCAAAKQAIHPVKSWLPIVCRVCIHHRIWIDWISCSHTPNTDLSMLPDVVHAQRRLNRLIRRYPPAAINKAFHEAEDIINYWSDRDSWGEQLRQDRYARLWWPVESRWLVNRSNVGRDIANFPEIVTLTGVFLSPAWRQEAILDTHSSCAASDFITKLGRRLNIPQFSPRGAWDHLLKWIQRRQHEHRRYLRSRDLLVGDHDAVAELDRYYNPLRHDWWSEPPRNRDDRQSTRWRVRYAYNHGIPQTPTKTQWPTRLRHQPNVHLTHLAKPQVTRSTHGHFR